MKAEGGEAWMEEPGSQKDHVEGSQWQKQPHCIAKEELETCAKPLKLRGLIFTCSGRGCRCDKTPNSGSVLAVCGRMVRLALQA